MNIVLISNRIAKEVVSKRFAADAEKKKDMLVSSPSQEKGALFCGAQH